MRSPYYHFSKGVQLRLVMGPGFEIKHLNEDEWTNWKSFTSVFVYYPKKGVRLKRGKWTQGFNFFVYSIQHTSDHAGRAGLASMGVGYPESLEPQVDQILNNDAHLKLLIELLKKIFHL
jgi:hypothetical protein